MTVATPDRPSGKVPPPPEPRLASGLSAAEAARRLAAEGPNLLPASQPKSNLTLVREVLTEPMFLMLLAAGAIYLALGDPAEALFLLGFVFVVIGITLAQERKTQRALEALRELSAPRALVIRDGQEERIAGRDVVRGDLLVLREGDRIAADAHLVSGLLEVDESLLTGEAAAVAKSPQPCAPAQDNTLDQQPGAALFASSVVTRGSGLAEVRATAGATAVGRIGADLAGSTEPLSALQQASRRLVRRLGLAALGLALAQVLLGWWWNGRALLDSLLAGIALAMALLPEEIPVILTVFLALGAWRISQHKVLTRRLSAVEALGAITVLAVDKTGTLTLNRMAVAELATAGAAATATAAEGATMADATATPTFTPEGADALPEEFHRLAEFALLATPGEPFDPMEKAIAQFGRRWLAGTEHMHDAARPEFEYALSGEMLAMTRVFADAEPAQHLLATKGAPEAVADLCHLDAGRHAAIARQVEAMAARGLRVLGVACGRWSDAAAAPGNRCASAPDCARAQPALTPWPEPPGARSEAAPNAAPPWPQSQHDFDFEFLGLVGLADPPRPEVPAALAECRRAGVRVIMLTGDHPATARAIAAQVGLSDRPEILTGEDMARLDDAALGQRLRQTDICARLLPAHKLRLVQLLRANGEVVAMTGDGVNDAPALKAADVGIAMGERGTDVAREAAALVLLDDSFARIVAAIAQGRRIADNLRKATRFVFAVHVPVMALALVPTLLQWPALLMPVHIVLLQLLIDPACSLVFEADPPARDLMARAPRPAGDSPFGLAPLGGALLQGAGLAAVLLLGQAWLSAQGWSAAQARTVVFCSLMLAVMLLILANRDPARPALLGLGQPNAWLARLMLALGLLLAAVLGLPWLRRIMGLALPGAGAVAAGAALLALCALWLELVRLAGGRLRAPRALKPEG